ncbi:hypothetical protein [Peribacillus sp. R9-11]|uniref:hypothetical protein n=1 Tax=Peribacillus sp. R9-11 TaxID=3073271 RepID=UPI00286959F3|nr:hypothetical protein [Peribacillus sp. R9-11]WMX57434.1 hypothetical protein RE409_09535 [Peribacillus sp. R9-11]
MSKLTFMDACVQGEALLEDIDEYIEEWHESETEEEIYDFLGMTLEEYGIWVENDFMLKTIFYSREIGKPIIEVIKESDVQKLVARAETPEEAAQVKVWLKKKGWLS